MFLFLSFYKKWNVGRHNINYKRDEETGHDRNTKRLIGIVIMSCVMRKLEFCLCKNKGADQLCSNCTAPLFSIHG